MDYPADITIKRFISALMLGRHTGILAHSELCGAGPPVELVLRPLGVGEARGSKVDHPQRYRRPASEVSPKGV